jgi:hypothetical protein|nr:MAG TPA: copper resistance protein [Caudoviricetes sp.]
MSIVINRGQDALSVEIINAQGKKDFVFVQGRGKVTLPKDCKVSKNYLIRNPQVIVR